MSFIKVLTQKLFQLEHVAITFGLLHCSLKLLDLMKAFAQPTIHSTKFQPVNPMPLGNLITVRKESPFHPPKLSLAQLS